MFPVSSREKNATRTINNIFKSIPSPLKITARMQKGALDPTVQTKLCNLLVAYIGACNERANLNRKAVASSGIKALLDSGCVECVIQAMYVHSRSPKVQESACRFFCDFTAFGGVIAARKIVASGGVSGILTIMRNHTDSSLRVFACAALVGLSGYADSCTIKNAKIDESLLNLRHQVAQKQKQFTDTARSSFNSKSSVKTFLDEALSSKLPKI